MSESPLQEVYVTSFFIGQVKFDQQRKDAIYSWAKKAKIAFVEGEINLKHRGRALYKYVPFGAILHDRDHFTTLLRDADDARWRHYDGLKKFHEQPPGDNYGSGTLIGEIDMQMKLENATALIYVNEKRS